ncbi:hypothetical protein S83_071363, partial [Arachis hypogaea]
KEDGLRGRRKNSWGQWRSKARPSRYQCTAQSEAEGGDDNYKLWWWKRRWATEGYLPSSDEKGLRIIATRYRLDRLSVDD